jgi:hypothetical protein
MSEVEIGKERIVEELCRACDGLTARVAEGSLGAPPLHSSQARAATRAGSTSFA